MPEADRLTLSAPPLVTEAVWNAVQARFSVMNARYGGSPKKTRMLSGLVACPFCGGSAITRYQTANGKPYRYFVCSASRKARWQGKGPVCHADVYPMPTVEEAVLLAVREAYSRPDAIAEAVRVFRKRERHTKSAAEGAQREQAELDKAFAALEKEEAATGQAQVQGIMAGANPAIYATMFAALAARRKTLEQAREARQRALFLQAAPRAQARQNETEGETAQRILADAWRILNDPNVPGPKKRQILGTVVQRVVCGKEGARVQFVPGLFGENAGEKAGAGDGSRQTCYTTCIGIRTQR